MAHSSDYDMEEDDLNTKRCCVIIDPFSDFLGKHLKRHAKARGLVCIDVLSAYTAGALGSSAHKWRAPRPGKEHKRHRDLDGNVCWMIGKTCPVKGKC